MSFIGLFWAVIGLSTLLFRILILISYGIVTTTLLVDLGCQQTKCIPAWGMQVACTKYQAGSPLGEPAELKGSCTFFSEGML